MTSLFFISEGKVDNLYIGTFKYFLMILEEKY
jgi:hypothetical protein